MNVIRRTQPDHLLLLRKWAGSLRELERAAREIEQATRK